MKNAIILHGTKATPQDHWFEWLKKQLEGSGYEVWLPQLPNADRPNMRKYLNFLLDSDFDFNAETILVGHSSGAVAALGLCGKLTTTIKAAYLVSAFKDDLGWEELGELFNEPVDFDKAKQNCDKIVFIHSDNDPFVPLEQAQYLAEKVNGKLVVMKGQEHFNTGHSDKYKEFPELLELIK